MTFRSGRPAIRLGPRLVASWHSAAKASSGRGFRDLSVRVRPSLQSERAAAGCKPPARSGLVARPKPHSLGWPNGVLRQRLLRATIAS
jgi:hypothetical protein